MKLDRWNDGQFGMVNCFRVLGRVELSGMLG